MTREFDDQERSTSYDAARANNAAYRRAARDDDYVDWSKTRRMAPARNVRASNIAAFGVPFCVAAVVLLWFSLRQRNAEVEIEPRAKAVAQRAADPVNDAHQKDPAAKKDERVELVAQIEKSEDENPAFDEFELDDPIFVAPDAAPEPTLADSPATEPEPTLADSPATEPEPSLADSPATEPEPTLADSPAPEPAVALDDSPALEPAVALDDSPALEPAPTLDDSPATDVATDLEPSKPTLDDSDGELVFDDDGATDDGAETTPSVTSDEPGADDALDILATDDQPELFAPDLELESQTEPETDADLDAAAQLAADQAAEEEARAAAERELAAARDALAQIEYRVDQIKASDVRDPDALRDALKDVLEDARDALVAAPDELKSLAQETCDKIAAFDSELASNAPFYRALIALDREIVEDAPDAALDRVAALAEQFAPDLAQDFARAKEDAQATVGVERWNDFMTENGERLERFRVSKEDAALALKFLDEFADQPCAPTEFDVMKKRAEEWRFEARSNVAAQRKIILMIESEVSQKYWTYAPSRSLVYYLPSAPRAGANVYVADMKGLAKRVTIPETARELALDVSPQKTALQALGKRAWEIPDELRDEDYALWCKKWCEFLAALRDSKDIDPIMQYFFFKDATRFLAAADYYFARQFAPVIRLLNIPQLEEKAKVDRFQTESDEIKSLRDLAATRLNFVPTERLVVDKTTAQLDAQTEKFARVYKRIGWLDRNFSGDAVCRIPEGLEIGSGDLFVCARATESSDERTWIKIGSFDGKRARATLASELAPRGAVVYCRVALGAEPAVARRAALDVLFDR